MATFTQQRSQYKNVETLRMLVPVIIIVILIVVGKKMLSGIFDGIAAPFKSLGHGLGLTGTAEENAAAASTAEKITDMEASESNPFSADYYLKFQKKYPVHLLTGAASLRIAAEIKEGIGYVYDSPDIILGGIKKLKYRTQVSYLAKVFSDTYGLDLFDFLTTKLDTASQKVILGKIITYVNKLPVGRV